MGAKSLSITSPPPVRLWTIDVLFSAFIVGLLHAGFVLITCTQLSPEKQRHLSESDFTCKE
jgi:hypothetical protein